jgi:hypothetical protein
VTVKNLLLEALQPPVEASDTTRRRISTVWIKAKGKKAYLRHSMDNLGTLNSLGAVTPDSSP